MPEADGTPRELTPEARDVLLSEIDNRIYGHFDISAARALELVTEWGPVIELLRQLSTGCGVAMTDTELETATRVLSDRIDEDLQANTMRLREIAEVVAAPNRLAASIHLWAGKPEWLAKHVHVPPAMVEAWCDGSLDPTDEQIALIADYCGESFAFLTGQSDDCREADAQRRFNDEDLALLSACRALLGH